LTLTIGGAAVGAFADSGGATANVTGGTLTATGSYTNAVATATLKGSDQTASYALPITVTDATGSGLGWNLTISGSSLNCQSGVWLGKSNAPTLTQQFASASGVCANQGVCTNIASSNPVTTAFNITNQPTKFFEADTSSGMGIFTVTTTVNYETTIHISIAAFLSWNRFNLCSIHSRMAIYCFG
jgi:WxL domain surface cell wall-binding